MSLATTTRTLLDDHIDAARRDPVKRKQLLKAWLQASRQKGDPEPSASFKKLATLDEVALARSYLTLIVGMELHASGTAKFSNDDVTGFRLARDGAREGLLARGLID